MGAVATTNAVTARMVIFICLFLFGLGYTGVREGIPTRPIYAREIVR
jgi:hypothetical protein